MNYRDYQMPLDGKKIRILRKGMEISQKKFANGVGVPSSNVCAWEMQRKPIPIKYNQAICELLEVEPEMLRLNVEPMQPLIAVAQGQMSRLHVINANWHLLPIAKQQALAEIVHDHLREIVETEELL